MKMAARPPSSEITTSIFGMNKAISRETMNQMSVIMIRRRRSATSRSANRGLLTNRLSIATLSTTQTCSACSSTQNVQFQKFYHALLGKNMCNSKIEILKYNSNTS